MYERSTGLFSSSSQSYSLLEHTALSVKHVYKYRAPFFHSLFPRRWTVNSWTFDEQKAPRVIKVIFKSSSRVLRKMKKNCSKLNECGVTVLLSVAIVVQFKERNPIRSV